MQITWVAKTLNVTLTGLVVEQMCENKVIAISI